MRVAIDGREQIVTAGQTISMPRGARQTACNNKPEVLHCVLEYKPGLDSYKVFQCFGGLTLDGDMDSRGIANAPKMMYFLRRMNAQAVARPSFLPGPLFSLLMTSCFMAGSIAGWDRLYRKYTG
jgi:hypothetical protein